MSPPTEISHYETEPNGDVDVKIEDPKDSCSKKEEELASSPTAPENSGYFDGTVETETNSTTVVEEEGDLSEKRIIKNVFVICVVFLLNFTSYGGLAALQSSLHREEGMGVITSAIGFASLALSSLFLPKLVMRGIGHKWCMSIALICYIVWMAANGYAVWATMIPASIICGIGGALLWTAQGSYFAILARHYAQKKGQDIKAVTALFFGIFFAFFRATTITGSIISSTILSQRPENVTEPTDEELSQWCGLNDCPGTANNNTNLNDPSETTLWTLVGVYTGLGVISFIVCCVFVDSLPKPWVNQSQAGTSGAGGRESIIGMLSASIMLMRDVRLILIIPLTLYSAMGQTFREAEYTKSFVSCFLGMWMIGWCLIPSAVVNAVASLSGGRITKYTGILPLFIFGFCMDLTFHLILIFWSPDNDEEVFFFIVPCFNTLADAMWFTQMNALYSILFPTAIAAAFSNYNFWKSCGHIMAYAYSSYLCTSVKLYILMAFLGIGMALFLVVYFVYLRNPAPKGNTYEFNVDELKQQVFTVTLKSFEKKPEPLPPLPPAEMTMEKAKQEESEIVFYEDSQSTDQNGNLY